MNRFLAALVTGGLAMLAGPSGADEAKLSLGGDQYTAGQSSQIDAPVAHDAFMAGYDVSLQAPVAGDAHLAGYNVTVNAAVTGDVYAAGFNVNLNGAIGGDVTAMGNSVRLAAGDAIGGNVRLAAENITIARPVNGAALTASRSLTLDAPVTGDFNFYGETLTFGTAARIDGILTIRAPKEIAVPATVASADRVKFELLASPDYVSEAGKTAEHAVRSVWPAVWGVALWWLFLFVVGAALIALWPRAIAALEEAAQRRVFRNLFLGILGFAAVVGLVPVFALTLIGIVLLPFVFVFVVVACGLAYVFGTYLVAGRIAAGLMPIDTNLKRIGVLAVGLIAGGLLGMLPLLGWLITLLLLIFGFGVVGLVTMRRWTSDAPRLPAAAAVS